MRSSLNARARRLAITVLAAAGLAVTATPALASPAPAAPATYLALGDSVPFGFRAGESPLTYADPANFVGYPELVGQDEHLTVLDASCPGETTDSFMDVHAQSNGCENSPGQPAGYRSAYPLHVDYGRTPPSTVSQLDYAVQTLRTTPNVQLVTLQLGANDGFLCQATTPDKCAGVQEVAGVANHVRQNIGTILSTLRTRAHYTGRIVVVTYYSLDYSDKAATLDTEILNAGIAAAAVANRATIASGVLAFLPVAVARGGGNSTTAGLVLPGDVHPTAQGQRLLADAVECGTRF
jgi:lysophospholipase L1-like esterase